MIKEIKKSKHTIVQTDYEVTLDTKQMMIVRVETRGNIIKSMKLVSAGTNIIQATPEQLNILLNVYNVVVQELENTEELIEDNNEQ